MPISKMRLSRLRTLPLLFLAAVLASCGALPPRGEQADSHAPAPSPSSPLVRVAQASVSDPPMSGFRLMPVGFYSLDARIEQVPPRT